MAKKPGYGQFCPIALAAEILAERWMPLVIRELLCGSVRFNDLQRGVPRMSSALLAQRLKQLQFAGIVERQSGERWLRVSPNPCRPRTLSCRRADGLVGATLVTPRSRGNREFGPRSSDVGYSPQCPRQGFTA